MRILICGGRDFEDRGFFLSILEPIRKEHRYGYDPCGKSDKDHIHIITGYDTERDYPSGADKLAYIYARDFGLKKSLYPYHYNKGKAGGSTRNQQMLDEGKPDLVVAFPTEKSRGTWDMVRRAKKAGVPVQIHQH